MKQRRIKPNGPLRLSLVPFKNNGRATFEENQIGVEIADISSSALHKDVDFVDVQFHLLGLSQELG